MGINILVILTITINIIMFMNIAITIIIISIILLTTIHNKHQVSTDSSHATLSTAIETIM